MTDLLKRILTLEFLLLAVAIISFSMIVSLQEVDTSSYISFRSEYSQHVKFDSAKDGVAVGYGVVCSACILGLVLLKKGKR